MKLFLASSSPRRKELLEKVGYSFEIIKPEVEEIEKKGESPRKMVERFAMEKALAAFDILRKREKTAILIAADTTVVSPDRKRVLNKPTSESEAERILRAISGKTHAVLTSYVICSFQDGLLLDWQPGTVRTSVSIRKLSRSEISDYIRSGEPMDKAGAYGAQGIGMCLIESIRGSYSNVVGLPMTELTGDLEKRFKLYPNWKRTRKGK